MPGATSAAPFLTLVDLHQFYVRGHAVRAVLLRDVDDLRDCALSVGEVEHLANVRQSIEIVHAVLVTAAAANDLYLHGA